MTVKFFTTISLGQMKKFLFFDLVQKISNCLTKDNALGDRYASFQTKFNSAVQRLDEALLISRKSLLTPEIQKQDDLRVQEWRVIRASVKEQAKLPEVSTSADFVLSLINNHGDVQAMKVTERTGALTNLCQDLTEKYADLIEQLGMTNFAQKLTASNNEYLRLYEDRLHQWSEFTTEEVQKARTETNDTLENLCIMVASGILTEGMEPFKHFVDYTNEAIKVAKIAMGQTTTKPDDEDDATDTNPGTPDNDTPNNPGGGNGDNNNGNTGGDNGSTGGGNTGTLQPDPDPDDPDALKPGPGGDDPDL